MRVGGGAAERFVHDNFLSRTSLQMLQAHTQQFISFSGFLLTLLLQCMRQQFIDILRCAGFLPQTHDDASSSYHNSRMLGGSAANENSGQEDVIKAVVAAGLYPNVVISSNKRREGRPSKRPPRLTVRGIGQVELHPKSALFGTTAFPQPYLVYHTLVRSTACFVHDATCVPVMALILFGGKLSVRDVGSERGAVVMTLDGWLTLHLAAESAACIVALTQRMQRCLQAKFSTPSLDV
jgi:ATP-dependent RNA helicase DHX36